MPHEFFLLASSCLLLQKVSFTQRESLSSFSLLLHELYRENEIYMTSDIRMLVFFFFFLSQAEYIAIQLCCCHVYIQEGTWKVLHCCQRRTLTYICYKKKVDRRRPMNTCFSFMVFLSLYTRALPLSSLRIHTCCNAFFFYYGFPKQNELLPSHWKVYRRIKWFQSLFHFTSHILLKKASCCLIWR